MPVRKLNTVTERLGVNYVRDAIEANNSVFKEQDLRHDYGHDAFVLLVEGEQVLPKEIAMQIKSGASYCTSTTCKIPATAGQLMFWAGHDLETLGVVYDPSEDMAYWVNLKVEARQRTHDRREQTGAVIEFPKSAWNRLDAHMFREFLIPVLQGKAPTVILQIALDWAGSRDFGTHEVGVRTLAARHRREASTWKLLVDLFEKRPVEHLSPTLVIALAKLMGHEDLGYYSGEIPEEVRRPARARLLSFGPREISKLLAFVNEGDGFERGSMGYGLLSLIGARADSPMIIRAVRDDATNTIAVRERAGLLCRVYEDDPDWWSFWRRDR